MFAFSGVTVVGVVGLRIKWDWSENFVMREQFLSYYIPITTVDSSRVISLSANTCIYMLETMTNRT